MQRRCLLCVFAATCICVAHGVVLQTDVPRLHTSFHNRALRKLDAALSKSALNELSHTYDLGHGRKLEQSSSPVCFWDQNSDECSLATTGREDFLNQAGNVVAGFLLRTIQCEDAQYKEGCEEMNCIWVEGSGCFVRHDEVRDFYDVDCMEEVQYLVEALAGNHECLPRETEMECSGFERCYWNDGRCNFDRWRFYHGIPTVDGYPETFQEVLAARNLQLTNDIQDATDNGDVGTYADLPGWDPPAFNCPVIYEEVICNYVDALTPYLVYTLYCGSQYQSATDIIDCNNDPLCAADTNNPGNICGPSQDALLPSLLAAELAFALGIEDPEAQLYECTRTECLYITEESECEENCEWVNDACRLSDKWQEEEVYRIVGDTDNPVCQYYVLPATSGCYDRDGEDECTNDPLCFYVPETGQCEIAFNAQVAFSLELSGLSESYDATTAECEAQDEEETCEAVEAVGPEQRGRGGRRGGRRDREDEEGASDTISTLSANQGGQISEAAAPSSVSADDEELEEIEGSLPELIEPPEASAEPSIEAMSPSASSAVDDEIGRVQGLGGILGFGRR